MSDLKLNIHVAQPTFYPDTVTLSLEAPDMLFGKRIGWVGIPGTTLSEVYCTHGSEERVAKSYLAKCREKDADRYLANTDRVLVTRGTRRVLTLVRSGSGWRNAQS